ncbi:hypothetical protein V1519DRAFT_447740, partial [Lipomyces tetrasporus]
TYTQFNSRKRSSFTCTPDHRLTLTTTGISPCISGKSIPWFTRCDRKLAVKEACDLNLDILCDYFYQDLVDGDNHPEPAAVHAHIDTVLKQKYYPGHKDEYSERIDEYLKVAHASVLDREAIDAIHAGMDSYLEWMASMDIYLEQLSTRRAEAEDVDSADEVLDIDEPTKLNGMCSVIRALTLPRPANSCVGDPIAPGPEYCFPETPFVEWDMPSSQSTHSYISSSQLPQPDDDPQPDDAPRSSSPLSDSSSMSLDNAAADRFAAIRKSLESSNCDCGGLRKVHRRFKTEDLAQRALKILQSDHYHLIDPLMVRDDEEFSMTVEENERLCCEVVKHIHLKLHRAPLGFDPSTVSSCPLPLDPFFLGLWIGDGSADSTRITSSASDPETRVWLQSYVDRLNSCRPQDTPQLHLAITRVHAAGTERGNGIVCNSDAFYYRIACPQGGWYAWNPVLDGLRKLGLLGNKTAGIPDAYMDADEDTRLAVVAGLIVSDGSYDKSHNQYRFQQNTEDHKKIVYDLQKLAKGNGRPTPRKKMNLEHTYKCHDARPFTVSDAPAGEYRAIQVRGGQFQLANRLVVCDCQLNSCSVGTATQDHSAEVPGYSLDDALSTK